MMLRNSLQNRTPSGPILCLAPTGKSRAALLYCSRLRLSQTILHTNPKRQRGHDLATSLTLRVSLSRNREQYNMGNGCRSERIQTESSREMSDKEKEN